MPRRLAELLYDGSLDVAVMAKADGFGERFNVAPLYRENFVLAFPTGHRFEQQNAIRFKEIEAKSYLRRINCEYRDHLHAIGDELGVNFGSPIAASARTGSRPWSWPAWASASCRSISVVVPGLQTRRVIEPDVVREVSVVTVAGRRFSPAVAAFVRAVKAYPWPTSTPDPELH